MNSVLIVLPILSVLMFDLGLGLTPADFSLIIRRPRALLAGLLGQIVFLPSVAFIVATFFDFDPFVFSGFLLIACCPGGSSSNVFTGIARGDVALSVSLTAFSSIITLFTLPLLMGNAADMPRWHMVVHNLILVLAPIALGMAFRAWRGDRAVAVHQFLGKVAFPCLMLLAVIFFVVNRELIVDSFGQLGSATLIMLILAMACGQALGNVFGLGRREKRTLVIEVGMQNAAQAMALAASPFVFNMPQLAVPATVYALMMNVVLLIYVGAVRRFDF